MRWAPQKDYDLAERRRALAQLLHVVADVDALKLLAELADGSGHCRGPADVIGRLEAEELIVVAADGAYGLTRRGRMAWMMLRGLL